MQHPKKGIINVEKSKVNLDMSFDMRDVIDILVSEQEQNIENTLMNFKFDLQNVEGKLKLNDKKIQDYIKTFVKSEYLGKFDAIEKTFKDLGLPASVKFEIMEGRDMPTGRPRLTLNSSQDFDNNIEKVVVALIICNTSFDRSTVDGTLTFYLETEYDDTLKSMYKENEKFKDEIKNLKEEIRKCKEQLSGTDRLVRRARAAVTKKAVGEDVDSLLDDFRKQYPQVELKAIENKK